ncbi:EAL domain-containing protein [Rhizobium tubonense]|uniref:bifunctional diguanylate cyclase/phosphodiesterase n=1 Tax=Rhizobium tubonense TaxID=484088 RepID=UPI0018A86CC9|nr:EAL domain-containing protein [Rhizobium tubonense]
MFLPAILALFTIATLVVFADHERAKQVRISQRTSASEQLATLSARLETNINGNVNLLQGLVAAIATEPQMSQERFSQFAGQLFRATSQLRNVAGAPDLVVRYVYPGSPNEKAIGLDYRKNEQQRDGALMARNSHNIVLAGPVDLVQGGSGLIARCPVYISVDKAQTFWGIISGVIDLARLYEDSGLMAADLDVAISLKSNPKASKDVFFGKLDTFDSDPVRLSLNLGYNTWELAAVPKGGWAQHAHVVLFRIGVAVVSLCIISPLIWAGFLMRARQKTIVQLQRREDELEKTKRTLEHQSLHDSLTGLPNRRYVDQMIASQNADSGTDRLAFIHVDLDRFKEVNDTLGHAAGDEVLRLSTAKLQTVLGPEEFAARIGGDEFVIVTGGRDPEQRAIALATDVVAALAAPILINGRECRIGGSAGVAWQSNAGDDLHQLLVNADISLYEAKKRGRGRTEIFSDELRAATLQTKQTADDLILALQRDEIIPYFQPQFDATTLRISGVEALARWDHPQRGILTPDRFLSVAETINRVADIDACILEKALFQATRWAALDLIVPQVSVNISAQRLKDPTLLTKLRNTPFRKGGLSFELLESISFDGHDSALQEAIKDIKAMGIDIEIDDFGTGHASIISLLELAPKRLKIDRKLIAPITTSHSQRRLVASIIEIGRSQNIGIVAEGVETFEHANILGDLGCHFFQGYAFARPMPAREFIEFAGQRQSNGDILREQAMLA